MLSEDILTRLIPVAVVAYFIGSVNLSIIAAKCVGVEGLRKTGSGNPGVTNLYRAAGARIAVPVLIGDIVKAVAAVNLVLLVELASFRPLLTLPYLLGNLFPVFHGFKGGKGVAAAVGAIAGHNPLVMLLGGGVFISAFMVSKRVSVSSLSMGISYPLLGVLTGESRLFLGVACLVSVVLTATHRRNIVRLIQGTEPRLQGKKR